MYNGNNAEVIVNCRNLKYNFTSKNPNTSQ